MSLKNMALKMALAFAAAKGVQTFKNSGGMDGIRRKMAEQKSSGQGGGAQGGIGDLLDSLGLGGGGSPRGNAGGNSIGGILGGLAGAAGGASNVGKMRGLLDTTRETPEGSAEEEQVSGLMVRAMVQAARADGEIDAQERETLMQILGDMDPQETEFLQRQMSEPVDAAALARDTPEGHGVEVYTSAVLAIEPDNRQEATFLDELARGLGLSQRNVNDIHDAQGKPPLYTL